MARIDVRKHYIGLDSQNNMIYPGLYEVGDPLLYGLERDLIDIGYAVMIADADEPPAPEDKPPAGEKMLLEDMTIAELKALAEARNVDTTGLRTKADIIAALVLGLGKEAGAPEGEQQDEPTPPAPESDKKDGAS